MFEALGFKVLDLKRTQIGPLKLNGLKEGHWHHLTANELRKLQIFFNH
jgi:16S rRNA U516 pseudouridylate synthase RsuA-like enzyme